MNELYSLVNEAQQRNKSSLLKIIEKFTPLIKKYSRKLDYDGSETDLTISLIETINALPLFRINLIKDDKYIVGYIAMSIKNKYIYLSKKYGKIYNSEVELNLDLANNGGYTSMEESVLVKMLLDKLPKSQRNIITERFINDLTDVEIAGRLNISRQAVNRGKNRGLKSLKQYLEMDTHMKN